MAYNSVENKVKGEEHLQGVLVRAGSTKVQAQTYTADAVLNNLLSRRQSKEIRDTIRHTRGEIRRCAACHASAILITSRKFQDTQGKTHSFANTPLKAAQAPLATAKKIHCDLALQELTPPPPR